MPDPIIRNNDPGRDQLLSPSCRARNSPARGVLRSRGTSAVFSAPREQSKPNPHVASYAFPAHRLIPFFSGFYEDQCLQLGKGAETELQEEALSHQAPPRCECKCLSEKKGGGPLRCPGGLGMDGAGPAGAPAEPVVSSYSSICGLHIVPRSVKTQPTARHNIS